MTPRSLFVIIIKIIGIFIPKDVLLNFNQLAYHFIRLASRSYEGYADIIPLIIAVSFYSAVFYVFVFRPDLVINRLKLDEGFYEEQFTLSMDKTLVIRMVIMIAALYLLADALLDLCKYLVMYYQASNYTGTHYEGPDPYSTNIVFAAVKSIIAYVMLTNSSYIANFITRQEQATEN